MEITTTIGSTKHPGVVGWHGNQQQLEARHREGLSGHIQDVGAVECIYAAPPAWVAVRNRWQGFLELAQPNIDKLAAWLATGEGDGGALRSLALAELAGPVAEADLRTLLIDHVLAALNASWTPVARAAYRACGQAFDSAVAVGDAAQMDQGADALAAAARLLGAQANVAVWATQRLQLGLCCDPGKAHLRRVAEAFCGPDRWSAVTALGAKLRAADDPRHEYPTLPAYRAVVDANRQIRQHDPLDPLPRNWQYCIDGWIEAGE